jgi:hypothetical protein
VYIILEEKLITKHVKLIKVSSKNKIIWEKHVMDLDAINAKINFIEKHEKNYKKYNNNICWNILLFLKY